MKKFRSFISVLMTEAMLIGCFTAAPAVSAAQTQPSFVVESVAAESGDKDVAVNVAVKDNPGIASLALDIEYDDSMLTLTGFTYNSEVLDGASVTPFSANAKPPCLFVVNGSQNIEGDFVLATLYFDISDKAYGNYDVTLSYDEDNVYNIDEENISFSVVNGVISTPVDTDLDNDDPAPGFLIEKVRAKRGEKGVAVSVSILDNPGIASFALDIDYDRSALVLTGFEYNSELLGSASTTPFNENADPSCLFMVNGSENMTGDGVIATLYFNIADDAEGDYTISLSYDEDNIYDIKENNIEFTVLNGSITVEASAGESLMMGDLDADKEITANDALAILRSTVGMLDLTASQNVIADVDDDTSVTASDALSVLRYSVGFPNPGGRTGEIVTV